MLIEINSGVAWLRQSRTALLAGMPVLLQDMHADINIFCDDVTKAMLGLRASVEAATTQAALLERCTQADNLAHRRELDVTLHRLNADLTAMRDAEAERQPSAAAQMAALNAIIGQQAARIDHLGAVMAEQARIFPSWTWTPAQADRIRAVLSLLSPVAVRGTGKIRVGRELDGGYVMLDAFDGIAAALSLGIADDVSWDTDIADRGIRVLQFDPGIDQSPALHAHFHFEKLRVAPEDGDGAISLDSILHTRLAQDSAGLLLKMDVEGAEWGILHAADAETLARFGQIVCEFHHLDRLAEAGFGDIAHAVFAKLAETHFVHHVHGNNCANFTNVANVIVPQSLEVSFGLRSAHETIASADRFPTSLDRPNQPGRADLYLGDFRFTDTVKAAAE